MNFDSFRQGKISVPLKFIVLLLSSSPKSNTIMPVLSHVLSIPIHINYYTVILSNNMHVIMHMYRIAALPVHVSSKLTSKEKPKVEENDGNEDITLVQHFP